MRSVARTVAVTVPALVVISAAWLRLEQPFAPLWRVLALVVLALAAAAVPGRWLRVLAATAATVAAARIAVGVDLVPWRLRDPGSGFGLADSFSTLGARFGDGFSDFYGTHLPFDPRVHAAMGELVLAGIFTFALGVALFAAARKPVASALVLLVGAGWPATLLGPSHGIAMGAAILGAALVVLAGLGSRRVPALALPATAIVAAGAVAVGSATAARHGLVHWQSWNLTHAGSASVGVDFVWDAQYDGLHWPAHPTVVLQVQSAHTPSYLRAAVLDDFTDDAWSIGSPRPADALEPAAALRPENETRESVTVEDLADTRLAGGSVPIRFAAGDAPLTRPEPGFASLDQGLFRGFRYTAWSYTARPSAGQLRRSPPDYPDELARDGMLDVGGGGVLPPFGQANRFGTVLAQLAAHPELSSYARLARLAERVTRGARTPFEAVNRLEQWFLVSGDFRYSNQPDVIGPPLVGFVTQTRTGYCQFFAGAMALMLRYVGVPARVAVGFAGGTYVSSRHAWLVTDREAHAWVEVWFKGYGWLPFDPTPPAPGSPLRPTVAGAAGAASGGGPAPYPTAPARTPRGGSPSVADNLRTKNGFGRSHHHGGSTAAAVSAGGGGGAGGGRGRPALLLLLVLAGAGATVVLAKVGFRTSRYIRRDPRRVAAACREELAAFLLDQRIETPRSATLGELGDLVKHEFGVDARSFVAAATAARFGPAEHAEAAARVARRELRELLAAARRCLTRRERLRGLLSLRSLTRPSAVDASASLGSGFAGSAGS
jgi:transglutaminase-like putative cysteine protease